MACYFCLIFKSERVAKVTCSHVHFKSASILKMVLHRDIVTTGH